MSSQDAVDFVTQRMSHGVTNLSTICEDVRRMCSAVNVTVKSGDFVQILHGVLSPLWCRHRSYPQKSTFHVKN